METNTNLNNQLPADEIDLLQLLKVFWKYKGLILFITILFSGSSYFYAKSLPNFYTSEVLLAPVSEIKGGGGNFSQIGSLAAMAGISIGNNGGIDKSVLAIETLKSREFLSGLINKYGILPLLVGVKDWDKDFKPIYDDKIYNGISKQWIGGESNKPSLAGASNALLSMISIQNDKTRMLRISITHQSPQIAKQWVTWLVSDINEVMKQRDTEEAQKSIDYLKSQIDNTNIADIKTILYQLIEEQTKTLMLVNVRQEYIFKTIDQAIVPEGPSKPKRSTIYLAGIFLGLFTGILVSIGINQFSKKMI